MMNETFLVEVLRNKDGILRETEENIKMLLRFMQEEENETESIRAFYLPKPAAVWGEGTRSNGRTSDLSDLYETFEKSKQRRSRESQQLLNGLLKRREEAEHVLKCYMVLPHAQHMLLKMYYEDGRKLEDIAMELGVSVKTAFNHRNAALRRLKESCESGLSPDVLLLAGRKKERYRQQKGS